MISNVVKAPTFKNRRPQILRDIRKMREEMEDLQDYLDIIEARTLNEGRPTYTHEEVKQRLGFK